MGGARSGAAAGRARLPTSGSVRRTPCPPSGAGTNRRGRLRRGGKRNRPGGAFGAENTPVTTKIRNRGQNRPRKLRARHKNQADVPRGRRIDMVPPCVRAKGTLDTRGVLHDGPHGKVARAPLRRGTAGCSAHLEQGAWRGGGRRRRATPLNSHELCRGVAGRDVARCARYSHDGRGLKAARWHEAACF